MEFQKIVAEVDFNYDDDKTEFKTNDRIARLNRFIDEDGQDMLGITFDLGRKEDDSMNLVFPCREFREKIMILELPK